MADVKTINGYTVKDETARTAIENLNTVQLASSGGASGSIRFGVDSNGKYGYYEAGADTVTPFSNGASLELIGEYSGNQNIDISAYPNSSIDDFVLELVEIPASGTGSQYVDGWNAYFQGIKPVKTISNNTLSITKAQCYIYLATTQSGTWHSSSLIKAKYNLYRKKTGGGEQEMPILDYANPLFTFSSGNLSYQTTQDCYLFGALDGGVQSNVTVTIDNTIVWKTDNTYSSAGGYGGLDANFVPMIHLKAGSTIEVSKACPNLHVYRVAS